MAISRIRSLLSPSSFKSVIAFTLFRSPAPCGFSSASFPPQLEHVGFIGLGNMGSRMANNLSKAGYKVTVYDLNRNVMGLFSDRGFLTKDSPREIAETSDVVISMLPSPAHVLDVYIGPNGLLSSGNMLRPWLFIDSSTIDPQTSRRISMAVSTCTLKEKKVFKVYEPNIIMTEDSASNFEKYFATFKKQQQYQIRWETPVMLDAPVSGGILAAEAGTLTFMVGGLEESYLAAKSLFLAMGKSTIYCGGAGNGSAAKICNNLAMAVSMLGVSEGFALGQSLGISATTLTKIFNSSSARCWSSDSYNPVPGLMEGVPSSRNYDGGFASKLMAKDLNLATASAKEVGVKCPLTYHAEQIFTELCEKGHEAKDFSCVFRHYYSGVDEQ